jgi:hypothetical protein
MIEKVEEKESLLTLTQLKSGFIIKKVLELEITRQVNSYLKQKRM